MEEVVKEVAEAEIEERGLIYKIAPKFSIARRYVEGTLAVHDGRLFRCVCEHYGAWDASHFAPATVDGAISCKAFQSEIAPPFRLDADYAEGDVATKDGRMVECVGAGRGLAAAFSGITVATLLARLRVRVDQMSARMDGMASRIEDVSARAVARAPAQGSDAGMACIAPCWAASTQYRDGDVVLHGGLLWLCSDGHLSGSEMDRSKWVRTTIAETLSGMADAFSEALRRKMDK